MCHVSKMFNIPWLCIHHLKSEFYKLGQYHWKQKTKLALNNLTVKKKKLINLMLA